MPAASSEITLTQTLQVECSRCRSDLLCDLVNRHGKLILRVQGCVVCREADAEAFGVLAEIAAKETIHA